MRPLEGLTLVALFKKMPVRNNSERKQNYKMLCTILVSSRTEVVSTTTHIPVEVRTMP